MSNEIRSRNLKVRASQGEEFVLEGNALSYSEVSSNELAPGIRERIMPGCFRASLASGTEVHALLNHDMSNVPLGRLSNGTLQLKDTDQFLSMRVQLSRNIQLHRDVYESVKRGDISEMSFAFIPEDEDMTDGEYDGERCLVRQVKRASIHDVSVVNLPFYGKSATSVAARSNNTDAAIDELNRRRAAEIMQRIIADYRSL